MIPFLFLAGIFLFFFPVFFQTKGFFSLRDLKLAFILKLFGLIPLQKGIIEQEGKTLFYESKKHKKKVKENTDFPIQAIKPISYRQNVRITTQHDLMLPVFLATMERIAFSVAAHSSKQNRLSNTVLIGEGEANLTTGFWFVGYISLFTLLVAWIRQRRKQHG